MEKEKINARFLTAVKCLLDNKVVKTKGEFAEIFGITPSKFSEILNNRMMAGTDLLSIICARFPDLSADWLLTGRGEMLRTKRRDFQTDTPSQQPLAAPLGDAALDKGTQSPADGQTKPAQNPPFDTLIASIQGVAEKIGRLEARIDELERRLAAQP